MKDILLNGSIERNALRLILSSREPLSQTEICERLDVSHAALSVITRKFKQLGFLKEEGAAVYQSHRPGRPRVRLMLEEELLAAISVWIESGRMTIAVCTLRGDVLQSDAMDCQDCADVPAMTSRIATAVRRLLRRLAARGKMPKILGVGIAFAAIVNPKTGMISSVGAMGGTTYDIQRELARRLDMHVCVTDVAIAACLAERYLGAACERRDFIYLEILPFLRSVVFIHDRLFLGTTGIAGEVGGVPLGKSDGGIRYQADLTDHDIFGLPPLHERIRHTPEAIDHPIRFQRLVEDRIAVERHLAACREDPEKRTAMISALAGVTGRLMALLDIFYNPAIVVIGGLDTEWWQEFLPLAQASIAEWIDFARTPKPALAPASFGSERRVVGPVCVLLEALIGPRSDEFNPATPQTPTPQDLVIRPTRASSRRAGKSTAIRTDK